MTSDLNKILFSGFIGPSGRAINDMMPDAQVSTRALEKTTYVKFRLRQQDPCHRENLAQENVLYPTVMTALPQPAPIKKTDFGAFEGLHDQSDCFT